MIKKFTKKGYLTVAAMNKLEVARAMLTEDYHTDALLFNWVDDTSVEEDDHNVWIELDKQEKCYEELKEKAITLANMLGFKIIDTQVFKNMRSEDDCFEYIYLN